MSIRTFPFSAAVAVAAMVAVAPLGAQGRGYHVEILAFRHVDPNTAGELFFPPVGGGGDWPGALPLWSGEDGSAAPGYEALDEEGLRMRAHLQRLYQAADYQPVVHVAWRQPAVSDPRPVRLRAATADCDGQQALDGIMRVRNLGELVFEFDLRYSDCAAAASTDRIPVFRVHGTPEVLFNRIYYFDHPLLGMLMEVRRD